MTEPEARLGADSATSFDRRSVKLTGNKSKAARAVYLQYVLITAFEPRSFITFVSEKRSTNQQHDLSLTPTMRGSLAKWITSNLRCGSSVMQFVTDYIALRGSSKQCFMGHKATAIGLRYVWSEVIKSFVLLNEFYLFSVILTTLE